MSRRLLTPANGIAVFRERRLSASFSGAEAFSQFFRERWLSASFSGAEAFSQFFFVVADLTVGANSVQFCLKWI